MSETFFKRNIIMGKDFKAINWGKRVIDLTHPKYKGMVEKRPVEIHLLENGDINNKPSFAIVMTGIEIKIILKPSDGGGEGYYDPVVGQISLLMFNEALNELGFEIVKK